MDKTIEYYMNLPYTIELKGDPEEGWFVRVRELVGCMSQGETAEEALAMIREAMELWLEVALEEGDPITEPRPEEEYSGKFVVRVPRSLHRELAVTADREGVSLNQYINVALAASVGRRQMPAAAPPVVKRQARRAHQPEPGMGDPMPAAWKLTQQAAGASHPNARVLHEPRDEYSTNPGQQAGDAEPEA